MAGVTRAAMLGPDSGGGRMKQVLTICCMCEKVRDKGKAEWVEGVWQDFTVYMAAYSLRPADVRFAHTYCPTCLTLYRELLASAEAHPQQETE